MTEYPGDLVKPSEAYTREGFERLLERLRKRQEAWEQRRIDYLAEKFWASGEKVKVPHET